MAEHNTPSLISKANYHLHHDDVDTFKAIVTRVAAIATGSDGCVFFHIAQDVKNPTTIYLVEGWDSEESVAAFQGDPGFQVLLGEALALRIDGRSGQIFFVSDADDMPMPA